MQSTEDKFSTMASGSFRLQGSSSNFASKLDSVFGSLGVIEKQHDDWTKSDAKKGQPSPQKEEPVPLRDSEFSIPRSRTKLDRRGQRSLPARPQERAPRRDLNERGPSHHQPEGGDQFRRPRGLPPPRRSPKVPDHRVHPEKWTKYSLDSVSDKDMSDRGNTAAAMSFFKEQGTTNKAANGEEISQDRHSTRPSDSRDHDRPPPAVINFRKRSSRMEVDQPDDEKRLLSTNKRKTTAQAPAHGTSSSAAPRHIMPEHVVGSSGSSFARTKKIMGPRTGVADRVNLSYLNHVDGSDEKSALANVKEAHFKSSSDRQAEDQKTDTSMNVEEAARSIASPDTCTGTLTTPLSRSATASKDADAMSTSDKESDDALDREDIENSALKGKDSVPVMMKRRKFRGNVRTRVAEADDDD